MTQAFSKIKVHFECTSMMSAFGWFAIVLDNEEEEFVYVPVAFWASGFIVSTLDGNTTKTPKCVGMVSIDGGLIAADLVDGFQKYEVGVDVEAIEVAPDDEDEEINQMN